MHALKALTLAGLMAASSLALSAQDYHHGMDDAMRHANPMPNLMQVIVRHGDELQLTTEQSKALAEWRDSHHGPMHDLVKQVGKMEEAMYQASLAGNDKAELMAMLEEVLELRRRIAAGKIDCRDNMRKILTGEQFDQVVSLYRQRQAHR
jgi:Spy/CpxP family protein refolding chaperone